MRGFYYGLGAAAIGAVSAWEYPYCEADGCYRNMIDDRFADMAQEWCPGFLATTATAADAIATEFSNCDGDVEAVSSACSCITYWDTTSTVAPEETTTPYYTTTYSSEYPEETEDEEDECSEYPEETTTYSEYPEETSTYSEYPEETTTSAGGEGEEEYTTSTVYTTSIYTVTQCPETKPDCPASEYEPTVTTETIPLYTTVCPVEETTSVPAYTTSTVYTTKVYTVTQCPDTKPDCPASEYEPTVTTETVPLYTTVCPVDETPYYPTTMSTSPTGTGAYYPTMTYPTSSVAVTAAAGRVPAGVEMAAAAAGLLAAAML